MKEKFLKVFDFAVFFAKKEIKNRYAGNFLGFLWIVIQPLFLIIIYFFVFSIVLKIKLPESIGTRSFIFFLISGLFPWMAFQEGALKASTSIIENGETVKKIPFPLESLPTGCVLSAFLFNFVGFFIFLIVYFIKFPISLTMIFLPLIIFFNFLAVLGISLFLSAISVYVRDIIQMSNFLFQLWFYITPIIYPKNLIPQKYHFFIEVNPFTGFIELYRDIIFKGNINFSAEKIWSIIFSLMIFYIGYKIFSKLKHGFSEII